jgi:hypothetical protein
MLARRALSLLSPLTQRTAANFSSQRELWEEGTNVPRGFWLNMDNRKKFLGFAETKLNINNPSGWYGISAAQLHKLGGTCLV